MLKRSLVKTTIAPPTLHISIHAVVSTDSYISGCGKSEGKVVYGEALFVDEY